MDATDRAPAPVAPEDVRAVLEAVPQALLIVNDRDEAVYANRLASVHAYHTSPRASKPAVSR